MLGMMGYRLTDFQRAAVVAYGSVSLIFFALPILIITAASDESLISAFVLIASFITPLLLAGIFFAEHVGSTVADRKLPSFLMSTISLIIASGGFVVALFFVFPGPGAEDANLPVSKLLLITFGFIVFLGFPASILGALLFIGGCQRSKVRRVGRDPLP